MLSQLKYPSTFTRVI